MNYNSSLFTQKQRAMREHLCSHMATAYEREKFAKRASHRLRESNEPCESIYAHIWRLPTNVRSSQSVLLIVFAHFMVVFVLHKDVFACYARLRPEKEEKH